MGTLSVDNLNLKGTGSVSSVGTVLQVQQTVKSDTFSTSSATYVDLTGLSVNITPSSTSNKILVLVTTNGSAASTYNTMFQLVRDSTEIFKGDTGGASQSLASMQARDQDANTLNSANFNFLDSPSTTSQVTYKVQAMAQSGGTSYVNRTATDSNSQAIARIPSSIIVMEIRA